MTIRRQYSLPNCTLVLEGLSDAANSTNERALMSILVNAECHLLGSNQILSGGRTFCENLVRAVSAYAQEFLSGIRHSIEHQDKEADVVYLESVESRPLHRLTWHPTADNQDKKVEIELTTVQLFDLVDAVDQFLADRQTLPDLSVSLQPVSRRYRHSEEPIARRAAPIAIGTTSLALAAIAFFLVPVPEVREPEPVRESAPGETVPEPTPEAPLPETDTEQ